MSNQLSQFAQNFLEYVNGVVSKANDNVKSEIAAMKFTDLNGFLSFAADIASEITDSYIETGIDNLGKEITDYVDDLKKKVADSAQSGIVDAIRKAISFADYSNYELVLSMLNAIVATYRTSGVNLMKSMLYSDAILFCQDNVEILTASMRLYSDKKISSYSDLLQGETRVAIDEHFKSVVNKFSSMKKMFVSEIPEDISLEIQDQFYSVFVEHIFSFVVLCVSLNPMFDEKLELKKENYDIKYGYIRSSYKQLKSKFSNSAGYMSETGKSINTEQFEKEKNIAMQGYNKVRKDALTEAKDFNKLLGEALKAPTPAEVLKRFYKDRFTELFDYMDSLKNSRNGLQSTCDALSAGSALPIIASGFTDSDIRKFYDISVIMEDVLRGSTYNINSDGKLTFTFGEDNVGALRLRRSSSLDSSSDAYTYLYGKYTELAQLIAGIKDYSGYESVNDPAVSGILIGLLNKFLKLVDASGIKAMLALIFGKMNGSSMSAENFMALLEQPDWDEDAMAKIESLCTSFNASMSNYAGDFIASATSLDGLTSDDYERQLVIVCAEAMMFPEMLMSTPVYVEVLKINGVIGSMQTIIDKVTQIQTTLRNMQMAANDMGLLNGIASVSDMLTKDGMGLLSLDVSTYLKDWLRVKSFMPSWLKKEKPGEGEVGKMTSKERLTRVVALVKNMKKIYKMIMPK